MAEEPVPGQPGNGVESTRLLEQVSGAGHHGQVVLAAQLRLGPAVEIQHHLVAPADDQQRRRGHPAPRQAEHHDRLAAQVPQPGGEPTPGIITISEHHDTLPGSLLAARAGPARDLDPELVAYGSTDSRGRDVRASQSPFIASAPSTRPGRRARPGNWSAPAGPLVMRNRRSGGFPSELRTYGQAIWRVHQVPSVGPDEHRTDRGTCPGHGSQAFGEIGRDP